jgi:hypothetical protein
MKVILVVILLILTSACRHKDLATTVNQYPFDKQVIDKLPLYDSLVNAILPFYPSPPQHNNNNLSYRYIPSSDGNDLYKVFPGQKGDRVKQFLGQLGSEFIYGFECYKDSTIKIMIRDIYIQKDHVNIMERISYYPSGKNIPKRAFPIKDTVLDSRWQYWIAFDEVFN